MGREMTSSFGIPDSALGLGTSSQGNPRMAGPPAEGGVIRGVFAVHIEGEIEGGVGSAPPVPNGRTLATWILPLGLVLMTNCAQKRGVGTPRSPSTWSRLFPKFVSPQGSFPRKLRAQERVKWTAEGRHSQVLCRAGGHAARRALVSYVRNEPASLRHPHPGPAGGQWSHSG